MIATLPHWMREMGDLPQSRAVDVAVRPVLRAAFLLTATSKRLQAADPRAALAQHGAGGGAGLPRRGTHAPGGAHAGRGPRALRLREARRGAPGLARPAARAGLRRRGGAQRRRTSRI
ncbi:hypothetical protein [Nocardioides convexus]|uniref:hypothetical protein n=1 Tax=Nocardioides convexus TaxID=2712224 RepID=UPI0024186FE5|nr:hypothetical protein [Nocardioides convexus]